jgi:hypothetical protein
VQPDHLPRPEALHLIPIPIRLLRPKLRAASASGQGAVNSLEGPTAACDTVAVPAPVLGPFTTAVRAALDEPMTERGSLAGQGADQPAPASVLFCMPLDDVRRRWPDLFAEIDAAHGRGLSERPGTCVDLVIEGSLDDGLTKATLESVALADLASGFTLRSPGSDLRRQLLDVREWVELAMPIR